MTADFPSWLPLRNGRPYIIAEAGVNHNGSVKRALQLIDAAAAAEADAVKFQAFTATELTVASAPKAAYQKSSDNLAQSQLQMLAQLELTPLEFVTLKQHCDKVDIDFLVTPFSPHWVPLLDELSPRFWKIGSGNLNHRRLLEAVAKTGRPILMSTGMAGLGEVVKVVESFSSQFSTLHSQLALLHCVSLYPTRLDQANLHAIGAMAERFDLPVGYSDHTIETITGALAVAAGAAILEKHFTLDKSLSGPDHAMSLTPTELGEYVTLARQATQACGHKAKIPLPEESEIRNIARLSLVAARVIRTGQIITEAMLTEKRPGTGIRPDQIDRVIGRTAKMDLAPDDMITWDVIQ